MGYRFGQDSLLLAGFFRQRIYGPMADLCAGAGAVSIPIGAANRDLHITAVEINPAMARMAMDNATASGLANYRVVVADVMAAPNLFKGRPFAAVVSNPPYRKLGSGRLCANREKAMARHEIGMTLAGLVAAAAMILMPGGTLAIVMISDRREEYRRLLADSGFHELRSQWPRHSPSSSAKIFLSEAELEEGRRP